QRDFKTEASDPSLLIKPSNTKSKTADTKGSDVDERQKFKLMFDSPKGYHRQIAAGVDENASTSFDTGYDALLIENNKEDMFWISGNDKYVIQGVDNFNETQKLPLGIKVSKEGMVKIKMDVLENIPENQKIYLNDKGLGIEHPLKESHYEVYLLSGNYSNRFEITFKNSESKSLHTDTFENENIQIYFSNEKESFIIHNPALTHLKSIEIINFLGQSIYKFTKDTHEKYVEFKTNQMRTGAYIVKVQIQEGSISKKILIK
ncbi:MAG: T9SS type A sorting domain-containing protein, partial [Flavobacteriales bacterium]